jgi:NAD(P)-dependent dehydrogenase (short-subunit alcohol dehydrogenase family)
MNHSVILITGAAGNLGRAVSSKLAASGFRLALVDRTIESLDTVVAGLPKDGEYLALPSIDLSDSAAATEMAAHVVKRFGVISGLVNTVGGFRTGPVIEEAVDQWQLMMTLNAYVTLTTSAAVLPFMRNAGFGRIVHVSAAAGLKAGANQAAYAASKAAVIRVVESIAEEHRKDGITANCILPSTIDTPQNRADMPDAPTDSWVRPSAIAELIEFLVSEQSRVVTGSAINATGLG